MGFLLGLAVGLFVGIFSMLSMVFLNGVSDAGQWAQAIGGVCAVAVAVYIPLKIKSDEQRTTETDRALRAKFVALAILPDVYEIRAQAEGAAKFLEDCRDTRNDVFGPLDAGIAEARVTVPEGVMRNYSSLYLLGRDTAGELFQMIALCEQLNRAIAFQRGKAMHTSVLKPFPAAIRHLAEATIPHLQNFHG